MNRRIAALCALIGAPVLRVAAGQDGPCAVRWPGRSYSLGACGVDSAPCDFDGDGRVDVLALDGGTGVLRWLRSEPPGFAAPVTHDTGANTPGRMDVGDLDGDGDVDLVVSRTVDPAVTVVTGDGAGGVGTVSETPAVPSAQRPVLSDLDGDGDLDVILRSLATGDLEFHTNDGAGGLSAGGVLPVGGGKGADPAATDLNGDGDVDLVAPFWSKGYCHLYPGDGAGGFAGPLKLWLTPHVSDLAATDLDDDGLDDLLACGSADGLTMTRSLGGFGFEETEVIPTVSYPYLLDLADVDGDGDLDVLAPSASSPAIAVHRLEGGALLPCTVIETFAGSVLRLAAGDVLGDATPDVWMTRGGDTLVRVFEGDGPGVFHGQRQLDLHEGDEIQDVVTADLDADGLPEVVGCTYHGLNVAENLDGETFAAPLEHPAWLDYAVALDAGDVDGDGHLDVVALAEYGSFVFRGFGNGLLDAPTLLPTLSNPTGLELTDVDVDGDLDLVVAGYTGVSIVEGDGAGTFSLPATIPGTSTARGVAVADLDGSGVPDVALTRSSPSGVGVLLDPALAAEAALLEFAWPDALEHVDAGDVNADGVPDVVAGASSEPLLVVVPGAGAGAFGAPYPVGTGPASFARDVEVRDVDGDAVQDVVVGRGAAGLAVLRGDGLGGLLPPVITGTIDATFFALDDFDADGRVDALAGGGDHRVTMLYGSPVSWWSSSGSGCPGLGGHVPALSIPACHDPTVQLGVHLSGGPAGAPALVLIGAPLAPVPVGWSLCSLQVEVTQVLELCLGGFGPGNGVADLLFSVPPSAAGSSFAMQAAVGDPVSLPGFTMTNALRFELP